MKRMRKGKMGRRAACLLLSCVLLLAMGMTCLAQDLAADSGGKVTSTAQVTVTGIPTDKTVTFSTWPVVEALYDKTSNSLEYRLSDWAKTALVGGEDGQYTDEKTALEAVVAMTALGKTMQTTGKDPQEQSAVLNLLAAYGSKGNSTGSWTQSGATATASLALGAYLVIPSGEGMSFLNMLVSVDTTGTTGTGADGWVLTPHGAVLKGKEIKLEKQVKDTENGTDGKSASAAIGDTVYYTVTAAVPQFSANAKEHLFKITDTPINVEIQKDSLKVEGLKNGKSTALESGYTVSKDAAGGALTVDFTDSYFSTFYEEDTSTWPYDSVKLTYAATIKSTAAVDTGNPNTVKLVYGKDSTLEDKATVYTYAAELIKLAPDKKGLAGAGFQVKAGAETPISFLAGKDGYYRPCAAKTEGAVTELVTGAEGKLKIIGLDAETEYTVWETKAPSGYSLNANTLAFTLHDTAELDGKIESIDKTEKAAGQLVDKGKEVWTAGITEEAVGTISLSLTDSRLVALPATGGIGTLPFLLTGAALMLAAGAWFLLANRKRKGE